MPARIRKHVGSATGAEVAGLADWICQVRRIGLHLGLTGIYHRIPVAPASYPPVMVVQPPSGIDD